MGKQITDKREKKLSSKKKKKDAKKRSGKEKTSGKEKSSDSVEVVVKKKVETNTTSPENSENEETVSSSKPAEQMVTDEETKELLGNNEEVPGQNKTSKDKMTLGTVKFYRGDKGFGFIKASDKSSKDVFIHHSLLESRGDRFQLEEGQELYYTAEIKDGRLRATALSFIDPNTSEEIQA